METGEKLFEEPAFPVVDSTAVSAEALQQGFPGARAVDAEQLGSALADHATTLLVMPYRLAFPEAAWASILRYLNGGDLIALAGKTVTWAAFQTSEGWQLRPPSVAFSLELFIADYQQMPGSSDLRSKADPNVQPALPVFAWKQAFSPVIRLSVTPMFSAEIGSPAMKTRILRRWPGGAGEAQARSSCLSGGPLSSAVCGRAMDFLACEPGPRGFDDPGCSESFPRLLSLHRSPKAGNRRGTG